MTKAKIDYSKAKIYRIESINEINSDIYIGSTTKQYLSQRFSNHKAGYKQWKKVKTNFITSFNVFEKYGIDNCQIVLIEAYPCTNVDELRRRESYFIKHIKCVNKNIAGNTGQESAKASAKAYYFKNKDDILLQRKSELIECECGSKHRHCDKAQHRKTKVHQQFIQTRDQTKTE